MRMSSLKNSFLASASALLERVLRGWQSSHKRNATEAQAERDALQEQRRLRQILDNLPALAGLLSLDGILVEANQGALDLAGLKREDVIGKPFDQTYWWAFDPNVQATVRESVRRAAQGELVRYDAVVRTGEGRFTTIDFSLSPVRDERGNITALLPSAIDISERLRMEEERAEFIRRIAQERERLDNILSQVPAIVWEGVGKPDGTQRVLYVNQYAETLLGYPISRWLDECPIWPEIVPPEDMPLAVEQAMAIHQGQQPGIIEFRIRTVDGRLIPIEAYATSIDDPAVGGKQRMVGVIMDASERKRHEALLQRTLARLESSNQELQQFAYIASHDLQEPLRMVTSYLQLIEERYRDKLDADGIEFIHYATDGARRMSRLIHDLLEYSRVETHEAIFAPVNMNDVLRQVQTSLALVIAEAGAVIHAEALPTVQADFAQMVQLLQNLVSNAIKFRKDAPPEVTITTRKVHGATEFTIRDNGIGIALQFQERIFEIFQRLHSHRKYPGTGIGLAICKRVVERHGGRIWVTSEPGAGSAFHFTIADVSGGELSSARG